MTLQPLLPPWMLLLVALLAAAAWWRVYRGPSIVAALRAATIALLLLMLANPVAERPAPLRTRPALAIVLDASLSMERADAGPAGRTRLAAAQDAVRRLQASLQETCDLRVLSLADGTLAAGLAERAAGDTDFGPLARFAEHAPRPRALVLLSDGAAWKGPEPDEQLAAAGIAVHALAVGSPQPVTNAAVRLQPASPTVAPGQELPITATVTASPDLRGRGARLVVERMDDDGGVEVLHDATLALAAHQVVELVARVGERAGGRLWRARLEQLPGELSSEDNTSYAAAQVVADELRVAVVEGQPWWDTSFAVRSWRRDRQLQVATVYGLGAKAWRSGAALATPLTSASLTDVDVVVLGRRVRELVGPAGAAALAAFVDGGGGLLLLGAEPSDAAGIDALDPLRWGRGQGTARADAERCALPGLLPPGAGFAVRCGAVDALQPQTRVLLGSREQPLIALRRSGGGWVCAANIEGVWRWQLGDPRPGQEDAGERFWRQLLRALLRPPAGALRAERTEVAVGAEIAVWLPPERRAAPLMLHGPDGRVAQLQPSQDTARVIADRAGLWRFRSEEQAVTVVAAAEQRERLLAGRDDARLDRLARRTGGSLGDIDDIDRLERRLVASAQATTSVRRSDPLITLPWWFLALFALLCAEWALRRVRHGAV